MTTPERHCTSSREGKGMLSCLIPVRLLQELDRALRAGGLDQWPATAKEISSCGLLPAGAIHYQPGGSWEGWLP